MGDNDSVLLQNIKDDPGRTRTCNPLIRSQMPYPLGHRADGENWYIKVTYAQTKICPSYGRLTEMVVCDRYGDQCLSSMPRFLFDII